MRGAGKTHNPPSEATKKRAGCLAVCSCQAPLYERKTPLKLTLFTPSPSPVNKLGSLAVRSMKASWPLERHEGDRSLLALWVAGQFEIPFRWRALVDVTLAGKDTLSVAFERTAEITQRRLQEGVPLGPRVQHEMRFSMTSSRPRAAGPPGRAVMDIRSRMVH